MSESFSTENLRAKSAGAQLRWARESAGISVAEVEERLHWLPGYCGLIESDNYGSLRRPAFARGYVATYCKLLHLDSDTVLAAFDQFRSEWDPNVSPRRIETRPPQLHHTGIGVAIAVVVISLLVLGLWWWQGRADAGAPATRGPAPGQVEPGPAAGGER